MKRILSVFLLMFCCAIIYAQDLDIKIQRAVTSLSTKLNYVMDVNIGSLAREDVDTPSAFSRYVIGKVNHCAVTNNMFNVKPATRSMSSPRKSSSKEGVISGTYIVTGSKVDVTLQLTTDNGIIDSAYFSVTLAELKKEGIEIEVPNKQAVQERDQVLTQLNVPINNSIVPSPAPAQPKTKQTALEVKAWPNTDTYTYIDGDEITVTLLANQNCYFKVFHIDLNNAMQLIYPNTVNRDNQLKANQQRTIPEAPVAFSVQAPFGQDTILVIASNKQFTDLSKDIDMAARGVGIKIKDLSVDRSITEETITTRFNFTSLPNTYYDYSYTYSRPDNVSETIQALRTTVQQNGGTFNGNDREGTFSVAGTTGNYQITNTSMIFNIRNNGNQLPTTSRSLGSGYKFSIDKPSNINQAIQSVRSGIEGDGGIFEGNEKSGNFSSSGISGQYNVGSKVDINISQKPFVVPNALIEKKVREYFSAK